METNYSESDWKIFKTNIATWQENYMNKLIQGYVKLLTSDKNSSDKFWALERRINNDKKKKGIIVTMSRSKLFYNLLSLYSEGVITDSDVELFSPELKNAIYMVVKSKI